MKKYLFFALAAHLLFINADCKKEPPVTPPTNPLQLTVEDVSCTEAFLKLTLGESEMQKTITLKRGDSTIAVMTMTGKDSLIVDEGLLPNTTYTYTLAAQSFTVTTQATTMDTTSHNWTWQVDTLGIGDSYLYDVAIINDTLAYAVGQIHIKDSTGQYDNNAYNLIQWDGKKWKLCRIQFLTFCENSATGSYPTKAIWAYSATDVRITSGSQMVRWDGINQTPPSCIPVSVTKLWGENSNSLYAIGYNGVIAHYNGSTWQKIESGTTITLNDVWGGSNKWLGNDVMLIAASEKYTGGEHKILRIKNSEVDTLPWPMQNRRIHSTWFNQHSSIFTSGGGVFQSKRDGTWKEMSLPLIYTNRIRGNDENDIVVVGDFGIVAHYNGVTWKVYNELKLPNGNYESVAIKGNLVIAVGWYNSRAYIAVGKR